MIEHQIGHDRQGRSSDEYFVYEASGDRPVVFTGTYTQCLIVVGGLSLGHDYDKVVECAREVGRTSSKLKDAEFVIGRTMG